MEIRMVPEVENWLAGIRVQDPAAADGIDEARKEAAKAAYLAAQEAVETTWAEVPQGHAVDAGQDGPDQVPSWLSELRPAAPESADTRILFTVEPSGTAVLLAAGTESDRLDAWYTEAIVRSRFRYQRTQRR
jgi:hypothetical protein